MSISKTFLRIRNHYRRRLSVQCGRRLVELRPKLPIISFTFDDFPQSALRQGGAILKRHGIRGTYYTSLGLMGREMEAGPGFLVEDLRQAMADGHEVGCHTFAHCHSWETKPGVFEESIIENKHALSALVPGASFRTLSYPIHCPRPETKRRAARHFTCCRGGGQTFNLGKTDLNWLSAYFLEQSGNDPGAVKKMIDLNRRAGGWLILATHDVCESPTSLGCTPTFFEEIVRYAVASEAQILPVVEVYQTLLIGNAITNA